MKAVGTMNGSRELHPLPNITLTCISRDARDLLDKIMDEYKKHHEDGAKIGLTFTAPDDVYGAFYWLVRYSGLVKPTTQE